MSLLAENLALEIREHESMAKTIVAEAKVQAAEILADAQAETERSMKSVRQLCHRQLRESLALAEREAETKAAEIMQKGQSDARAFYEEKKDLVENAADWLVREVIETYGIRRDD